MSAPAGVEERRQGIGEEVHILLPSLLNILPTELIEKILDFAIFDLSKTTTTASLDASLRFYEATKYSLVCRQWYLLCRPRMYKSISISIRQMSLFSSTIQGNQEIAKCIKDMTLEGRIWTDIDQDVVVKILLAVRRSCVRVNLGANESLLLPYMLHGPSQSQWDANQGDKESESSCALQVLNVCWRDEVQVQSQWNNRAGQQPDLTNTLCPLFQHKSQHHNNDEDTPPSPFLYQQTLPNLTHLTLDLYSQIQLDQIFDSNGYFVKVLLPKLQFLRIEMPYVVLQFSCRQAGNLVKGWPKDDFLKNSSIDAVQEAIDIRQDHTRRVIAKAYQNNNDDLKMQQLQEDMIMPYCPANQLKSLTLRFLLNVHRNDMTLFHLICPIKALEQSWSTRASVAAHCLSSTMQMYLNNNTEIVDNERGRESRICSFPFAHYKSKGAEVYWKQKWAEADADYNASLPNEIRVATSNHHTSDKNTTLESTKVSLLLKWPHAVDAFFHYSAMI